MSTRTLGKASIVVAASLLTAGGVAYAAPATYVLDASQSTLTVIGTLADGTTRAQTTGSLTTSYAGTIVADRTATSINFAEGSNIDANRQPVNQQPRNNGSPGSDPADYGRTTDVGSPFFAQAFEALRNFRFDLEDDEAGFAVPLSGNNFDSRSLVLLIDDGQSDVAVGIAPPVEVFFDGRGLPNGATTASSVAVSGAIETLTLRINTAPTFYSIFATNDSSIAFSGTLVATRAVPEPTGAVGLLSLLAFGLRRRTQSARRV